MGTMGYLFSNLYFLSRKNKRRQNKNAKAVETDEENYYLSSFRENISSNFIKMFMFATYLEQYELVSFIVHPPCTRHK